MCTLPSVSQYTNALFAELLNLLPSVPTQPAGTVMPVTKTELSPTGSAEVTQEVQVPQVPQLPATTALASSIPWPGQADKPIVGSTQPSPPSVVSATSANAVTTATSASTQVNTTSVGTSTAPTAAVSASPVAVSAVANPTQPVVTVKQYQKPKPYSGQTSHKSFREHFERVAKATNWVSEWALALEGPAIDCLREVKEDEIGAYDKLWSILANRFGYLDQPERAMRRFNRKQLDGESVAEYEQALKTLDREAWPKLRKWVALSLAHHRLSLPLQLTQ